MPALRLGQREHRFAVFDRQQRSLGNTLGNSKTARRACDGRTRQRRQSNRLPVPAPDASGGTPRWNAGPAAPCALQYACSV
jgi:hypothetical protein